MFKKPNSILLLLYGFCLLFSCANTSSKTNIEFRFSVVSPGTEDSPKTAVAIYNNDKLIGQLEQINEACYHLKRDEYGENDIPNDSLAAFKSWWAGSGAYYYAALKGQNIEIFRKYSDSESDTPFAWEMISRIKAK